MRLLVLVLMVAGCASPGKLPECENPEVIVVSNSPAGPGVFLTTEDYLKLLKLLDGLTERTCTLSDD